MRPWLSPGDKERTKSARMIRLIVDDNRWDHHDDSNAVGRQHFLREIADFIGPTSAVLATPAGMVTTTLNGNRGALRGDTWRR